jgi:hypothetical protein
MNTEQPAIPPAPSTQKSSRSKTILIVVVVAMITAVATVWITMAYLFPKKFRPVELSAQEEQVLDRKLRRLGFQPTPATTETGTAELTPEPYSETDAKREVRFSEREINGLIAKNPDLAHKLVIDFSDNLASAKLLIPVDPEFPFFGGKTLKVTAGLELRYSENKPVVRLKGISVWGVPLPNAWLGGIKNVDLVQEFGAEKGFWHAFAEGVEDIQLEEGHLAIRLKE